MGWSSGSQALSLHESIFKNHLKPSVSKNPSHMCLFTPFRHLLHLSYHQVKQTKFNTIIQKSLVLHLNQNKL